MGEEEAYYLYVSICIRIIIYNYLAAQERSYFDTFPFSIHTVQFGILGIERSGIGLGSGWDCTTTGVTSSTE